VPLATPSEISRIVSGPWPAERALAVIVPARSGGGTNALMLSPPDALAPCFGELSFASHYRQALERGLDPHVLRLRGLGKDIDEPADLAALLETRRGSARYAFLCAAIREYGIHRKAAPRIMMRMLPQAPMGVNEP